MTNESSYLRSKINMLPDTAETYAPILKSTTWIEFCYIETTPKAQQKLLLKH